MQSAAMSSTQPAPALEALRAMAEVLDDQAAGLCLFDLPARVGRKSASYTVVVSHGDRLFKFRVRPRWQTADRLYKRMGVEIADPPARWRDYVHALEPVARRNG